MQQIFLNSNSQISNNFTQKNGYSQPLRIDAPLGNNTLLFILSQTPRDFTNIFKGGSVSVNSANLMKVQCATTKRNIVLVDDKGPCRLGQTGFNKKESTPSVNSSMIIEGYAAQMIFTEGK